MSDVPKAKYKFIYIEQRDEETFGNKPVYRIYNNKSNIQLGIISYYKPWKQYVLSTQPQCVFNNSCLRDVLDFMEKKIRPNPLTDTTQNPSEQQGKGSE